MPEQSNKIDITPPEIIGSALEETASNQPSIGIAESIPEIQEKPPGTKQVINTQTSPLPTPETKAPGLTESNKSESKDPGENTNVVNAASNNIIANREKVVEDLYQKTGDNNLKYIVDSLFATIAGKNVPNSIQNSDKK